jgi:acyl carrier protein
MTRKEFLMAVDEMLELPRGTLQGPEKLEGYYHWDSTAVVSFMALADSNNGARIAPRDLGSCETVDDLLRIAKVEG